MDRDGWSREAEDTENCIMFNLNSATFFLGGSHSLIVYRFFLAFMVNGPPASSINPIIC